MNYKLKISILLSIMILAPLSLFIPLNKIEAEDTATCTEPPMLFWRDKPSNDIVPLNTPIKLYLKNSTPPAGYTFDFKVDDLATGNVTNLARKTLSPSDSISGDYSVSFNTPGDKSIYALYKNTTPGCYETSTNFFNFTVRSNEANEGDITLNVPSTINQGQSKDITFNIKSLSGWLGILYINVGGNDCIDNDTSDKCWSEKWRLHIPNNNYDGKTTWNTTTSTLLGQHTVKLKLLNGDDSAVEEADISICDKDGNNCDGLTGSGGSDSSGTGKSTGSSSGSGSGSSSGTGSSGSGSDSGSGSGSSGTSTGSSSSSNSGTGSFNFSSLNRTLTWFITGSDKGKDMTSAELIDIKLVINRITNYALDVAGAIAIIIIVYSAFMYATAFGEESKAEAAKKALTWSIIGMIVVVFSKVIVLFISKSI